jgi:DNA-binding transcriptional ArsR family regulator
MLPELTENTLADTASLIAESSRAAMLLALLDGRARTAGELARSANISPQTASFHLKRLACGNLLECEIRGRCRYFRLARPEIAQLLEGLLVVDQLAHPRGFPADRPEGPRDARSCYDHLAGRAGVHLYRRLTRRGWLAFEGSQLILTSDARELVEELGLVKYSMPITGRACLDWSECDFHIAGELGTLLLKAMLDARWFLRSADRSLIVTENGRRRLARYDLYPWAS